MSRADENPDATLLAAAARGEEAAIRSLVRAGLPRIHALATRLLNDASEADDVAQESFVRLWRQAPRWRTGEARVETWLHRVALNLCYDRLRKHRGQSAEPPPDRPDPAPLADARIDRAERDRSVAAAIRRLPDRQRDAILLCHYQELGNIEAAAILGVSVDALESLLARGRRTLRAWLREDDDDRP